MGGDQHSMPWMEKIPRLTGTPQPGQGRFTVRTRHMHFPACRVVTPFSQVYLVPISECVPDRAGAVGVDRGVPACMHLQSDRDECPHADDVIPVGRFAPAVVRSRGLLPYQVLIRYRLV